MTQTATSPLSVRAFLLDGRTPAHDLGDAVKGLSAAGRSAVDEQVSSLLAGLLDLDLGSVVIAAWRKHAALVVAGRATAADPVIEQVVDLAAHRISSAYRPFVDVHVGSVRVARIHLELSLTLDVTGLAAVVRQGRLVALRGGPCTLTGALTIEGAPVANRSGQVDLPLVVRLGKGVVLV